MKIIAVIVADLDYDFFNTPSTLGDDLVGTPALRRTVKRTQCLKNIDAVCVLCLPSQQERIAKLLDGLDVDIVASERATKRCEVMRRARSFGRYGWRGGLADATIFDELMDPVGISKVCNKHRTNAFVLVAGGAVLLNIDWTQQVIDKLLADSGMDFVMNQAPIGLSAGVFTVAFYNKLLDNRIHTGRVFGYDPTAARCDIVFENINIRLPDTVINTPRRFLADSPRGRWLCNELLTSDIDLDDGEAVCNYANSLGPEPWPREVAIELCCRRPFTDSLRPQVDRADLDLDALARALDGLDEAGDINIMFDGLGDCLLHPQWDQAVELASGYGIVGASTYLAELDDELCSQLEQVPLSILQVNLDSKVDETYALTRGGGSASEIWDNMTRLKEFKTDNPEQLPFVVPFMLKTHATLGENEQYYDDSRMLAGWSVLKEPSDYGGQIDFAGVFDMSPPTRTPCRRLNNSLAMTSDATICACEEEFYKPLKRFTDDNFLRVWRGAEMARLRSMHSQCKWCDLDLCANCREFHRP